jgi:hypothetical protein
MATWPDPPPSDGKSYVLRNLVWVAVNPLDPTTDLDANGRRVRNAAASNLGADYVIRQELEGLIATVANDISLKIDGTNQMLEDANIGGNKLIGVAEGVAATDGVNKEQMEDADTAAIAAAVAQAAAAAVVAFEGQAPPNRFFSTTTPGANTWVAPAGIKGPAYAYIVGGGGGGGGRDSNDGVSNPGAGGNGGKMGAAITVVPSTSYSYHVGGGGSRGGSSSLGGGGGGGGGRTTFHDIAAGGGGGGGGGGGRLSSTSYLGGNGGAGGVSGYNGEAGGTGGSAGTGGAAYGGAGGTGGYGVSSPVNGGTGAVGSGTRASWPINPFGAPDDIVASAGAGGAGLADGANGMLIVMWRE